MAGRARSTAGAGAAHREPSPDESTKLLEQWHAVQRLPFHENRWLCFESAERAMSLLDDFASLDISVVRARKLQAQSSTSSLEPPGMPYVSVLLDDTEVFQTPASSKPSRESPAWSYDGSVPFLSPLSMVRLQVKDRDSISHEADIGFVEFCLADLPWGSSVEGWLELRLQDKLEYTSVMRYADHRRTADSQVSSTRAVRKPSGSLFACSCRRQPPVLHDATNAAGEVFVRLALRLRGGCSRFDRFCALSLDRPPPEDHGPNLSMSSQTRPSSPQTRPGRSLPAYKIQDIGDNLTDLRHNVMENAVFSAFYVFQYVLQWRSWPLSIVVLAVAVAMWYNLSYAWVLLPGMLATMLLLFACEPLRLDMTTGGLNAPLSQAGFERVALWRSTPAMTRFLRRLVEEDLQGRVADQKSFSACAARCFAAGVPRVSLAEVRGFLASAEFTAQCQEALAAGTPVLAVGRRAVVKGAEGSRVVVEYEDGSGRSEVVERHAVVLRHRLPSIPEWALSASLGGQIRRAQSATGWLSRGLRGACEALAGILAWRRPALSLLVLLLLLAVSGGNALLFVMEHGERRGRAPCFPLLEQAAAFAAEVRGWIHLAVCVFVMIFQALWFCAVRNVLKVCVRLLSFRRNAPSCWAFYRADSEGSEGLKGWIASSSLVSEGCVSVQLAKSSL